MPSLRERVASLARAAEAADRSAKERHTVQLRADMDESRAAEVHQLH